jgi:N-acetylmuramoyl-L-alanine amidase
LLCFYGITIFCLLLAVHLGNKTVTVLSENQKPERVHCIIIDPGHGGEDGGAVSVSGRPESQYNLEISLRLNYLLQLLGYETALTRSSDISIYTKGETLAQKKASDLKARVRMVEALENPVLISIHQNHFPDSRYSGPQVFYPNTEGSEPLALTMQEALVTALAPGSNRKAKKSSGIYLMEHISCPAVLIECGFLSHYGEETSLRDPEYQKKLSGVIAATVSGYISNT